MICYLFDAPSYFFFTPDIPPLLYYSHIPTSILALLVGIVVFLNGPRKLLNQLLFLISILFSWWTLSSLIAWTNIRGDFLSFIWPWFGISAALISITCVYFIYVFLDGKDVSFRKKVVFITLLLPVILFGHTDLSIAGFNLTNCDAFDYEGLLYKMYYTGLGFLAMGWIFVLLMKRYIVASKQVRRQILFMGIGLEFFLLSFISITFIITYLTGLSLLQDSRLEMYGLFGMTVFMVMMGILIVRFKAFNVAAHASQALVLALILLVASQYTFDQSRTAVVLTSITLVLTSIAGLIIVKSVKKEIEQRKEIEGLVTKLNRANKRLKVLDKLKSEFVSIASHQLRSPLTSIRGYASMLLEGSFGKVPKKAEEAIERISESTRLMTMSVEDYLNVSRIQAGNMKYEISSFNVANMAEKIVDDLRREAVREGLALSFENKLQNLDGTVKADEGKTSQILHNLVDNAMKYTEKGNIKVVVTGAMRPKGVKVSVVDTGIGMDPEEIENLFEKFERAEQANSVNVSGTGLGLYIARKMSQDMGGDIKAASEGEGKGSTFTLLLPV
ncbi:hypothetical protein CL653_02705 [bacterium]|nr:hypothetical protein [bacterium]